MPELPEVEIVKRVVSPLIVGRTIQKIDILREQTILGDAHIFKKTLENAKCLSLSRIGKFLMFHFDEDRVIISHLRMEGKFYEILPDEKNNKYAPNKPPLFTNCAKNKISVLFRNKIVFGLSTLQITFAQKSYTTNSNFCLIYIVAFLFQIYFTAT